MTLIEVAIVGALATMVVMGMISFYISSQSTWMDGSTQALAQRDATLLIQTVSDSVRVAAHAVPFDSPDPDHQGVNLSDAAQIQRWCFWWDESDSLIHQGPTVDDDRGPVIASRVTRIQLDTLTSVLVIRLVELRAGHGQLVRMTSAAALRNRGNQ